MAKAGLITPTIELENYYRDVENLPEISEEEYAEKERKREMINKETQDPKDRMDRNNESERERVREQE